MRYYVLRPGQPATIRAEFVVEDEEAHAVESAEGRGSEGPNRKGMSGAVGLFVGEEILLRRELLADPAHLEALRRWDARDDGPFHTAEHRYYREQARRDSEALAQAGCRLAVDLLAHATDEELDDFVPNHLCRVEECGGSGSSVLDLESV